MTSKERLDAVIHGKLPDHVLVHDFSNLNHIVSMGHTMGEARWNAKLSVKCALDFNKISKADFVFPGFDIPATYMDLGMEVDEPADNYGSVRSVYYKEPEDVDTKELYDPFNAKECPHFTKAFVDKIVECKKQADPGLLISGLSWGVFTMAGNLRGTETLLMDVLIEPDNAKKVLNKSGEFVKQIESRCLDVGADICWMPDPTASESVISTEQFKEFGFGPDKDVISHVKKEYKAPVIVHICGDTLNTVKVMPELGVDVFSLDQIVPIEKAREAVGDKIILMGNVHPIQVMWQGTPKDVEKASKDCIDKAGKNGRFILSSGCEMPRDTPAENVAMLYKVASTYGAYPIKH